MSKIDITYKRVIRAHNKGFGYVVVVDGVGIEVTDDDKAAAEKAANLASRTLSAVNVATSITELAEDLSGSNLTAEQEKTYLKYLAVGKHAYGVGETAKEAKKNARKHEGRTRFSVYALPEGVTECWLDDLGRVRWNAEPGAKLTHFAGPDCFKVAS